MNPHFISLIDDIRHEAGFPFPVNSAFRHPTHPIEARKERLGAHTTGKAIDIGVYGDQALEVVKLALQHGIKRIGVKQHGPHAERFVHLDLCDDFPTPMIWTYE